MRRAAKGGLQHVDLAKPAASAFCLPSASPEALFGPTGFASRPVAHAINDWIIPNGLKLSGIPRAGKRGAPGGWSAAGEANPEYSLPGTFEPHSQSISRRSAQGQNPVKRHSWHYRQHRAESGRPRDSDRAGAFDLKRLLDARLNA